ncbi:MAG: SH3 domain-containing protein, partial [Arenicella sp.]|nr:SH3 domain-containing protein [Arenicella sp.]
VDTETATDLPQPELVANRSGQAVSVDPSPLPEPLVVGRAQRPVPVDPLPITEPLPPPAGPEPEPEPVSEPAEEMQLASAIVPTQTSTPRAKLKLYQDRDESSILLGSIRDDSEIIAIIRRGEWSTIMLSTGIPVWLPAANATELSASLVKVSSDDVGLRIRPELSREFIVTTVGSGDTLQVLEKSGSWYRVNTPADYEAWVKTDELNRLLE